MWAGHRWYEVLGRRYRIGSQDEDLLDHLDALLDPFVTDGHGARMADTYCIAVEEDLRVYRDCVELPTGPSRDHLLAGLLADLNQRAVDAFAGFAVHAGVVGIDDRVLAIPVESGGGKSTLTAALAMNGFHYLSDESLCVDYGSGAVIPYPKPISLAPWSRRSLGLADDGHESYEIAFAPTEIGAVLGLGGTLTDLVFPAFDGDSSPKLIPIARSDAQARVLRLSFNHYKQPAAAFELSARLARSSRCFEFRYSDPLEAARYLKVFLAS